MHAHAFPDHIAERAVPALSKRAQLPVYTDGTIRGLLASMERAGIERTVVASIATKPGQFESILKWSKEIASERIVPFPSVHPLDPEAPSKVSAIREGGFKGVKLHPYHQGFRADDPALLPVYRRIEEEGLLLLLHTGFDIAYPFDPLVNPEKVIRIHESFPHLTLITSHLGAWKDWDNVERLLLGKPVYMDISFSLHILGRERSRRFLLHHPAEYLLFGTDSPWDDQKSLVDSVIELGLPEERLEALLWKNAARLLGV